MLVAMETVGVASVDTRGSEGWTDGAGDNLFIEIKNPIHILQRKYFVDFYF